MSEYMTDEELMKFISDIEENDYVKAPPDIRKKVFEKIDTQNQILEYKRFRNRVIAAVAAIIIFTAVVPSGSIFAGKSKEDSQQILHNTNIISEYTNGHFFSELLHGKEE